MTLSIDLERSQEWLGELERTLKQCVQDGRRDIVVDYRSVSQSFPGGSHPDHFDVPLIHWNALRDWASNHGWSAMAAPESTHQDQQSAPRIRFVRNNG